VSVLLLALTPSRVCAQTDEIQVYNGNLAAPGVVNLTLHTNYTPSGITTPAFPGAVVADKSFNQVPEWAYGVAPWFEAGLYLPLYTRDSRMGWGLDGAKLRLLFAVPHAADRTFFYGSNFEFSYNTRQWDATRFTSEIRPIVGWHLRQVDIIVNPILDTAYDGLKNLEFEPATRVAYNLTDRWAAAAEEYADFGQAHRFSAIGDQSHQLYAVVDRTGTPFDVEVGVGFGLNRSSSRLTLKVILSRDLRSAKTSDGPDR
jgi:hypothetical protein